MKGGEWKDEQFLFEALHFQISVFPWCMKDSKLSSSGQSDSGGRNGTQMVWKHLPHFFFQHPVKMFVTMFFFQCSENKILNLICLAGWPLGPTTMSR